MTAVAGARTYEITAGEAEAGQRLDRLLAARLPAISRTRLKALIEGGRVTSGGETIVEPAYRVKPGQTFAIFVPEPAPAAPEAQAIALDIVYEDAHLIVLDKPAGMVVHPAPGNPDRTLVNALLAHCGAGLAGIGGVRRPGIVHRLDKDTSGLMVVAKTEEAYRGLAKMFAAREVERAYRAVVWGVPEPRAGEIAGNIGRSPRNRKKMAVLRRGGKPARTRYRVLKDLAGGLASLVECRLLSGRTHQIRVHMAAKGHPVLGDPLYGRAGQGRRDRLPQAARAALEALDRQALHAKSLAFPHPATGAALRFESELPQDVKNLITFLEAL
ncbi:MAG: RluA family pseudouridine synthase [Kiloniellaceae bacterium]